MPLSRNLANGEQRAMRRSKTINLKLDACDLQERGQLRNSRYDDAGITLDDRVLVEDDAPAIGQPQ